VDRACSTHEEKINAHRIFVGNPEGKRLLEKPRRRLVNTVQMDLRELELDSCDSG
jgi:hypothetical protein